MQQASTIKFMRKERMTKAVPNSSSNHVTEFVDDGDGYSCVCTSCGRLYGFTGNPELGKTYHDVLCGGSFTLSADAKLVEELNFPFHG